jgi:hypothetical protein
VSAGSIGWVFRDLRDSGYLVDDGQTRLLVDRSDLLQKWVVGYTDRLHPKLRRRTFTVADRGWWQSYRLDVSCQLWGGETAAAKLTGFLKPLITTVYSSPDAHDLILNADLRLDPDGDVQIVTPFWKDWSSVAHDDCVHPLLVYADLVASGIDRNMEAAQRIYARYLRSTIAPD